MHREPLRRSSPARHRLRLPIAILAAALVLAGCAKAGPADDNLINGWPMLPAAQYLLPTAGQCIVLDAEGFRLSQADKQIVDCGQTHDIEVVLVGEFTGTGAAEPLPPEPGHEASRAVYSQCDKAATAYLGADWRTGLFVMDVVVPLQRNWEAGARYFLCTVAQLSSQKREQTRTASLKGALGATGPLQRTCFTEIGGKPDEDGFLEDSTDMVAVDCATTHNVEFAGLFLAPDGPFPSDESDVFFDGCIATVTTFLGLSVRQFANHRDLWYQAWTPSKDRWMDGERSAECYVVVRQGREVKASLKGIGTKALPR